jgi:flavin-dependent dehydrogenase
MTTPLFSRFFAIGLMGMLPLLVRADDPVRADVVIYGGTSAGVAAAVQVARMGKSVIVIEPTDHLGGLTTNGLGATDSGRKETIGGISRAFYRRVQDHYRDPAAWPLQDPSEPEGKGGAPIFQPKADAMWVFEPKVAQSIMDAMAAESGAKLFF